MFKSLLKSLEIVKKRNASTIDKRRRRAGTLPWESEAGSGEAKPAEQHCPLEFRARIANIMDINKFHKMFAYGSVFPYDGVIIS